MKATIDIPGEIHRQVKARSALEGRSIRDVTIELYRRWLAEGPAEGLEPADDRTGAADRWLASWETLGSEVASRAAESAADPRTSREILVADRR